LELPWVSRHRSLATIYRLPWSCGNVWWLIMKNERGVELENIAKMGPRRKFFFSNG
jgi:hypothetical protein